MATVNLIQIKRSLNTASPGTLANGEFAYSANGDVLFIGSNATLVAIAGARNPGTLTANQALVANSTSYLDVIKTANLFIGTASVNTINAVSNSTTLGLASNSELLTSWAIKTYVDLKSSATAGANTQVQFNDSGVLGGSAGLTFNKATNNMVVANTITVGASVINTTAHAVGANVIINTSSMFIGNSVANSTQLSTLIQIANATSTANLSPSSLAIGAMVVNSTNITVQSITGTDATFSGNLTINGTLTTVDATNLTIKDPLIALADQNLTVDSSSIGLYGSYGNSTVTQYTGLFRDQAASGIWKLFNTQKVPTTIVDTANNTYTLGTLNAYLTTGAFVANSTTVNITGNSTVSVVLVANTLSLSTALPGTSGGTGRSTWTNQDLLVANSTNGITALALGASGAVYQSNGTSLIVATLDGGSF